MFQNKENQDCDLEAGLLDNFKLESKPLDEIQLKTFRTERKSEGRDKEIWSSTEFFDKQAETNNRASQQLEYDNILGNVKENKKKIRTFFNAIGALKTGSESNTNFNQAMNHEHYQHKWTALHHASAKGLSTLIQDLLNSGDDPNITDERGRTAIDVAGIAYYQGLHIESLAKVLQTLLAANGRFNTMKEKMDSLDTPIHTAVELDCMESIKMLINAGASVACLNSSGVTPLHLCIRSQQEECLKTLLKPRCDDSEAISKRADIGDYAGFTVLQAAVVKEWVQGVNILLDAGADVTAGSDLPFDRYNSVTVEDFSNLVYRLEQIHETPVHLAANVGNKDILRKLLNKNKSAVNKYNLIGQTPLYIAIRGGYINCIKTLLNMGANLMNVTNENENALHIAIKFNQIEVFTFLLDHDYDITNKMVNSFDNDGYAPIHSATMCNRVECIKLLAEKNFFLRLLTKGEFIDDWTPLHIAAARNFPKVAEILVKYDEAAIDDVDHNGRLPIHIAANRRNREVMAMLLRKGAVLSSYTETKKGLNGSRKSTKPTTLKMISSELPNSTQFLEEVFDSFIEPNINAEGRRLITMDYRLFTKVNSVSQIQVLEELVEYGHEKLLIHPLVESLIYLKWKSLLPAFVVIICIHICFALSLYGHIIGDFLSNDDIGNPPITILNSNLLGYTVIATLAIVVILLELLYINIQRRRYFCLLESYIKLGTIFLAVILLSTGETSWTKKEWSRHAATAALLLSWAQIMFLFSRFPNIGLYVLIFGRVSLNIFKILFVFSFLILAFALSFMIQYHSQSPFSGPWEAVIKTIVMMTSEFDYESIFGKDHDKELSKSKPVVHLLFILFILFISIVFVNFMVGVAVSDVNDLKVEGNIRRLEKQVEFLNILDVLAFGVGFKCCAEKYCASKSFISKRFVNSMTIKAGITKTWMVCYETKRDDEITMFENEISLPSHILDNIFTKINSAKEQNKEEKELYLLREQVHFIYNFTAGFIDKFLTNETDLTREIRIDKASYRLRSKSVEDIQELKDNFSNIKHCSKNQSTQTVPTKTRFLGPKYLGTRMYFTKQFRTKQSIKRNRLLQELKSKFMEEATIFKKSQLKRFMKLERMLKKV